jgi:serine/threonine protein kinase/Tol biopolymer transport system component
MTLKAGDRLGPYRITAPLGTGGMGEVFKAQDTRLNRFVAVKLIGRHLREHEESRRRLMVEAQAVAALSHPHICGLYDTGHDGGLDFLVLEYLEGETLAERLERGPIPLRDLVGWAIEIAQALEYAHSRDIVHRDLKPSNVFITRASGAKLMDFGLAAMKHATANDLARLGTKPVRLTAKGTIVGTLHYFAPERLKGADADARSDIFSYGALLYEMFSGKPAFEEATQAQLIAAILTREPELAPASHGDSDELRLLIRSCLAKEPHDRWRSMADAEIVLRAVASNLKTTRAPVSERRQGPWIPALAALALTLATLGAAVALTRRGEPSSQMSVSFTIEPPAGTSMGLTDSTNRTAQFAVAPDGHAVVFVVSANGRDQLWIRDVSHIEPRPVDGTFGASYPFWSPDSRDIGFFADRQLKRIAASGGPAQRVCDATNGRGGTWNPSGTILFVPNIDSPLHQVPATGGIPLPLAGLPERHSGHRWPQFLPDGDHVLYLARSDDAELDGLYATALSDPGKNTRLGPASTQALYASGHLLYVLDGTLVAQPFDPGTLTLGTERVPLRLDVSVSSSFYSAFSVSRDGTLVTWSGEASSELAWFSRAGTRLATVAPTARYVDFRLSPDQRRLAFARVDRDAIGADLWVQDFARGVATKLTSAPQTDASPVWAPDNRRVAFRSNRGGRNELFEHPGQGGGEERRVFGSGIGLYPTDWSPDGNIILYHERRATTGYDIFALDSVKNVAVSLVGTASDEAQGQIGEDGRLAFVSDQSGQMDVYVSARGDAKSAERVSVAGGTDPRWRHDGHELFFIAADGTLMSVDTSGLIPAAARPLFKTRLPPATSPFASGMLPSVDGQQFLLKVPVAVPETKALTVTTAWTRRLSSPH